MVSYMMPPSHLRPVNENFPVVSYMTSPGRLSLEIYFQILSLNLNDEKCVSNILRLDITPAFFKNWWYFLLYRMTNETEPEVQNSGSGGVYTHQPPVNGTNSFANDEPKGRVSISQSAIEADDEKQKRKTSILSSKSVPGNVDNTNNCYVNPTFQSCSTGISICHPLKDPH